jgi:acyl-coenzyme A synthetase/AMP-(fatty) acid ligase
VKKFVAGKVSRHKHLVGGIEFVTTIPKNPAGKILRKKLKEMYSK